MDRNSMIQFIQKNADASADQSAIAQYYLRKSEDEVRADYQRLLIGEQMKIVAADAETQKAKQAVAAQIAERDQALQRLRWVQICNSPTKTGLVVTDCAANRAEVESWFDPLRDGAISPAWFHKVIQEQPQLARRLAWTDYQDPSPKAVQQRNAQVDAATRATFRTLARDYDLSRCEANVQAVIQHFPDGVDAFQIGIAIQNHQLNLAPCNKQEHLEYTKELEAEYDRKWRSMPVHEVRKRSAECKAEREALLARHSWQERGVLTKEDEHAARQESIKQQEELLGYPLMPAAIGDTVLDAAYLRGCDRDKLTDAIRRWGAYQVNQRLVKS